MHPDHSQPLPALAVDEVPERFGGYEIDRVIGRGTHGVVFKGTDTHGLQVAIKWLKKLQDDSELATLVQLSKTVNGLPQILSSGTKDGRTYFVMPYYQRRSLRFRLRKVRFPQAMGETIRVARAFTETLGELHRHGFTHADFKPDNILLETLPAASDRSEHSLLRDDERLVLSDFGTVRSADGEVQFGEGTLGYAAPELLTTIVDHDPRIDVYAASATLVECITGVAPQQIRGPADSTFDEVVLRSTGLLEPTLRKGLSFEPGYRQDTMSEWFDALLAAAQAFEPLTPESQSKQDTSTTPGPQTPHSAIGTLPDTDGEGRVGQRPAKLRPRWTEKNVISSVTLAALALAGYWFLAQGRVEPALISLPGSASSDAAADINPDSPTLTEQPNDSGNTVDDVAVGSITGVSGLLEMTPDPTWGTPRRRLTAVQNGTDQTGQSDGARYHHIDATSRPVVSENERWILAKRDSQWTIVDRSTGDYRTVDIATQGEPLWHPSEPETILHINQRRLGLLATTVDGETTVAADLTDRIAAELPEARWLDARNHGAPSADGTTFAWAVTDSAGQPTGFVTYDLSTDTVLGMKVGFPDSALGDFDSIAISKSGDNVVVAFEQTYVIYDNDFTNERRINQAPYSYELALSGNDEDVLVVANFDTGTFGTGWIVAHNLDSGESDQLMNLYDGSGSDVQVSGQAADKPGWVLVSTHDCSDPNSLSCDRLMALNIDDATIVNLAQTESCAANSFTVPTGVVNRDFTKAWYNTDFGSCGEDATIVELTIDQFD